MLFIDSVTVVSCQKTKFHVKHTFTCLFSASFIASRAVNALWIGDTGRTLRVSFGGHRRSVTNCDDNQHVDRHFTFGNHCVSCMKIRALCPISCSSVSFKRHEMCLIQSLGTRMSLFHLNSIYSPSFFLLSYHISFMLSLVFLAGMTSISLFTLVAIPF